jgi:methionine-rich copper-binding protein CopC
MPERETRGKARFEGISRRIETGGVRIAARLSIFAVALTGAFFAVSLVFAHAEPSNVKPGSGAVLTAPPAEISILMSQEVVRGDQTGIDVLNEAGDEVTTVDAVFDNGDRRRMTLIMPSTLEPGVYTVRWRTLSAEDGDPDSGEYQFTYDPNGTADPGTEQVREELLAPTETATAAPADPVPGLIGGDSGGGTPWILVAAVGVGMLVLGSGVTFLLVQKRP